MTTHTVKTPAKSSQVNMVWSDYTWIFVCSIFLALFVAWGIGANDVANSFATSVGSKALSLRQAVIVAAIFEFGGAMLLGSGVTSTIRKGIAKIDSYTYSPELLMYMMLCAMLSAGLWLALATFLELPVSTTHSMVGAIVGASMIAAGADSVVWYEAPGDGDPFPSGVVSIVLAWIITPMIAAVVAALLFVFTKVVVLNARNPFKMSLILFPLFTYITSWVITYFVIQKGVNGWMKNETYTGSVQDPPSCPPGGTTSKDPKVSSDQTTGEGETCELKDLADISVSITGCIIPDGTAAWIAAVTAAVCALIIGLGLKLVVKMVNKDMAEYERMVAEVESAKADEESGASNEGKHAGQLSSEPSFIPGQKRGRTPAALADMRKSRVWKALSYGTDQNIHDVATSNEKIKHIHDGAQVFDVKTEFSFKYLQVITACANAFAHGANDVANSIGSFAAIYGVWQCTCAESKVQVPIWMFVIGGVGIVAGLATYGFKIMRALGVKLVKITNSRGYCAELTSSITVIVASRYGFPVSTTQVITGAITGIGLVEVISAKMRKEASPGSLFNWVLLLKFFLGWVATIVVAGLVAAAFTAQGIYAPYKNGVDTRAQFNAAFNEVNEGIANTLIVAGNVSDPSPAQEQALTWGLQVQDMNDEIANSDDAMLLDPNAYLWVFQNGSWYLGNSTQAGVLADVYAPTMPLDTTVSSAGFPYVYVEEETCAEKVSAEILESQLGIKPE